ncbi:MAG TPA: SMP-30/gluconolactonase/LRE family protein, partial [Dehalococcoidia bacterium]|nr:SMP-30/gluconolactonase/LRE family protein [Dehalococcoidia bacterium]
IGANGMVIHDRYVYVANTNYGRIVRIPIGTGSRAGTPEVFVEDEELLYGADGLTVDDWGTLYVAVNGLDSIAAISPSGEITTLAQGGGLQNPASVLAIGNVLYITNMALLKPEGTRLPALYWMQIGPMGTGGGGRK